MISLAVVPTAALERSQGFLDATGWTAAGAENADNADAAASAQRLARAGRAVLFVPGTSELAARLGRIVVVHDGTRGDRAGMDVADEAAVATGAEIIVLHVPPAVASTTSGSLPFRIADHGTYDWAEWRDEFLRRFCRCSEGVKVTLHVAAASANELGKQIRGQEPDLVVASSSAAGPGAGGGSIAANDPTTDAVFDVGAPALVVPAVGRSQERA